MKKSPKLTTFTEFNGTRNALKANSLKNREMNYFPMKAESEFKTLYQVKLKAFQNSVTESQNVNGS